MKSAKCLILAVQKRLGPTRDKRGNLTSYTNANETAHRPTLTLD